MSPQTVLWIAGVAALAVFVAASACQVSGDMLLPRTDGSWQQWLHVSKYPPSLAYATLELGLLSLCLAFVAFAMLALLNPACRWYRSFKAAHSQSF